MKALYIQTLMWKVLWSESTAFSHSLTNNCFSSHLSSSFHFCSKNTAFLTNVNRLNSSEEKVGPWKSLWSPLPNSVGLMLKAIILKVHRIPDSFTFFTIEYLLYTHCGIGATNRNALISHNPVVNIPLNQS